MPRFSLILILLLFSWILTAQGVLDEMKEHITIDSIRTLDPINHYTEAYEVFISQPINHKDKKSPKFLQKIYVCHYDKDAPTVIQTCGYTGSYRPNELSKILQSNLIIVEYRFYGKSCPEERPWQYLNNDQAIEDLHCIRKKLGKIYKGDWVSTGISKGGTTCMIYKAKYPKDVRVAVPYVGPMAFAQEDRRMDRHIKRIGTDACRNALERVQIEALKKSSEIIPMVREFAEENKWNYSNVSIEQAFEFAVLELTFSFWQFGHSCEEIPNAQEASAKKLFRYIKEKVGFDFYNDATYEYFKPSFYQFFTENGYYGFITDNLKPHLKYLKNPSNIVFGPKEVEMKFDQRYMWNVKNRLDRKGKRMLYIQGSLDPWAACLYRPITSHDALLIVKEGGDHSTRIKSLDSMDQVMIYEHLKKWLKLDTIKPI